MIYYWRNGKYFEIEIDTNRKNESNKIKFNKMEANAFEKIRTETQKQRKYSKKCLLNLEQKVEILT